ncbi:fatty acid desaturase [Nocardia neocaledoniensis]|uniref:Fatty acid desaturase n=1 Tax=Nocardia neocaledoniensis TaxID=236511 RepID=A0A317NFZ2_9NOCA|nr:fatty acid desaturase [Nocardia neocaledoniensis]PWV74221.1 fatty acid desaturase [Nocardia neocaledoniensis]GEM34246.1 membrane protein [Nocardia neocaledoniensis NBRC 108232]
MTIDDRPDEQERELPPPPGPGGRPPVNNVWVYNGRAYDLSEWISKHPGGEFFIGRTKNRDITSIIGSYHRDPEKIARMIERYSLDRAATPEDIHPKNNAPDFLFKDGFNSWDDTPKYAFDDKNDLLHKIKARIKEPELAARLKRMDRAFDIVVAFLIFAYFAVQGLRLWDTSWMPLPVFVIAMVLLRSSLAGFGHYAIHRAQKGLNKYAVNAFDMNYVALSFVTADGHALLHHPHTQSEVDIKKNVFTMMMQVPRLYRVPVHTVHKFGHLLTGMIIRLLDVCRLTRKVGIKDMYGTWRGALPHFIGSFGVRFLLVAEFVAFTVAGDFWAWALQFVITLWISTFMVVASHDFEVPTEELHTETEDWAVNQLEQAYDLTVVGNKYVDCFLSAGLSSHRVHHVLPFQRSGFANIATEDVVREESAKFGVEWLPAKSFFGDRFPKLCRTYLLAPSREAEENRWGLVREHCAPTALKTCVTYTVQGFTGIGTV